MVFPGPAQARGAEKLMSRSHTQPMRDRSLEKHCNFLALQWHNSGVFYGSLTAYVAGPTPRDPVVAAHSLTHLPVFLIVLPHCNPKAATKPLSQSLCWTEPSFGCRMFVCEYGCIRVHEHVGLNMWMCVPMEAFLSEDVCAHTHACVHTPRCRCTPVSMHMHIVVTWCLDGLSGGSC